MDVLSPDLMWIDGRCYRLPVLDSEKYGVNPAFISHEEWSENDTYMGCEAENYMDDKDDDDDDDDDEGNNVESMIVTTGQNRYELKLPIAQVFWPQIIGSKGVTKKRIENDTKTRINVPRPMVQGDVQIKGSTKKDIILAKKCIDEIVSSARQKLTFTHFISIPINNDSIKTNFLSFKEKVMKYFGSDRGVDETIFQNPNKLHLTLATLVLADQRERKLAEDKLNEVCNCFIRPLLENKKIKLKMKGIEYMNDDPSEVDVLYGKVFTVPDSNILQNLADEILTYFVQNKLIKSSERENVKLHVTLMNTLFREEELEEMDVETIDMKKNKKTKKPSRSTFNAVNILEKFKDYYFGEKELETIELSVRFSTAKNGYYKNSCVIHL